MSNPNEKRLREIQYILSDAESTLKVMKVNKEQFDDNTIKQRELFIKRLKAEEQELLKETGVKTDNTKETKKTKSKSKSKTSKNKDSDKE